MTKNRNMPCTAFCCSGERGWTEVPYELGTGHSQARGMSAGEEKLSSDFLVIGEIIPGSSKTKC